MKYGKKESEFETKGLPKGWIKTTLETISSITLGRSPPSSTYNNDAKGLPFYQGKADFGNLHPTPRVWCSEPQTLAEKDAILMSVRAPVGSINISNEFCSIGRGLAAIKPGEETILKYVFYQLRHLENEISQQGTGTTFKAITGSQLRTIDVAIPPLPEQRRIASKIESIFAQIDASKERLERLASQPSSVSGGLAQLKRSVLKQAFDGNLTKDWRTINKEIPAIHLIKNIISDRTKSISKFTDNKTKKQLQKNSEILIIGVNKQIPTWVDVKLENLIYISGRIGWRGLKADEYTIDGPLFLSTYQINDGKNISLQNTHHISQMRYDESPEIKLRNNDILLVKDGSGIGKISIVLNLNCPATVNSSLLVIRSLEAFVPKFLFYFLYGPQLQSVVHKRITGSAIPHLFQKDIKNFILSVPPINEQKHIVSKIESIFARIDARSRSAVLSTLQNLLLRIMI